MTWPHRVSVKYIGCDISLLCAKACSERDVCKHTYWQNGAFSFHLPPELDSVYVITTFVRCVISWMEMTHMWLWTDPPLSCLAGPELSVCAPSRLLRSSCSPNCRHSAVSTGCTASHALRVRVNGFTLCFIYILCHALRKDITQPQKRKKEKDKHIDCWQQNKHLEINESLK